LHPADVQTTGNNKPMGRKNRRLKGLLLMLSMKPENIV
jgi:hypothetical protein